MSEEYQPRTTGRLIEILKAQDINPRSWQQEAAAQLEAKDGERIKAIENLCRWRSAFQAVTPGGSEFMNPEGVREWAEMLKRKTHEAMVEKTLAERRAEAAEAQLAALSRPTPSGWNEAVEAAAKVLENEFIQTHTSREIVAKIRSLASYPSLEGWRWMPVGLLDEIRLAATVKGLTTLGYENALAQVCAIVDRSLASPSPAGDK